MHVFKERQQNTDEQINSQQNLTIYYYNSVRIILSFKTFSIMASNHNNHYINDPYSKEREHSSASSQYHASEKSISQSSRFNGSNKFCEEYSFNRQGSFQRDSHQLQSKERHVYRPYNLEENDSTTNRNPQLLKKYSSIYNELQDIQSEQIIHLFLQQIQENQRCRSKIVEVQLRMHTLQEQNNELKSLIQKKRQAIRKLCETESNNLNIIQCLQQKNDRTINWDSHYMMKYQELEAYMNEYISSTNEAQEELIKSCKLLKGQTQKLLQTNEKLQRENFERERELQVTKLRQMKCAESLGLFKEKQRNLMMQVENLQQQNAALHKSVEELAQNLRTNEQFEVQLTKQNRQLSSELDFIREKINQNQSLSRDIFEKIESHSQQTQRLNRQKQQLQRQLSKTIAQNQYLLRQKGQIESKLQALLKEFNQAIKTNQNLMYQSEQKDKEIQDLKVQIQMIKNQEQQLLQEFENEKQSKHLIKSQLIDLAQQVKFMESTYKKEIIQNQKIKMELQRFWEKSSTQPLKEVTSNGTMHHSSQMQSMKASKSSFSKNSRISYQHQPLF